MDTDDVIAKGDAILVHHGVKGMKWGQRKNKEVSDSTKKDHHLTDKQKKALMIGASASLLAGGMVAAIILNKNGKKQLKDTIIRVHNVEWTKKTLGIKRDLDIVSVHKAVQDGKISRDQGSRIATLKVREWRTKVNKVAKENDVPLWNGSLTRVPKPKTVTDKQYRRMVGKSNLSNYNPYSVFKKS